MIDVFHLKLITAFRVKKITDILNLRFDCLYDPCVGSGDYVKMLKQLFPTKQTLFCDIDPQKDWIEQRDFINAPLFIK